MVTEELIDRLDDEIGERLQAQGRAGRRRALAAIAEFRVLVTRDGHKTWEEAFDRPPTLGQLVERVGRDAFVVSVQMQPKAVRSRVPAPFQRGLRIAAE